MVANIEMRADIGGDYNVGMVCFHLMDIFMGGWLRVWRRRGEHYHNECLGQTYRWGGSARRDQI